ncbi:hypothetical protein WJX73_004211 [Symbiochloris irregularis]|uniref:Uncharacterized protein n=1 Tax=Symbiochloris irregularis TaxID=706552 RepID=A0AAW1PER9_9CHLO
MPRLVELPRIRRDQLTFLDSSPCGGGAYSNLRRVSVATDSEAAKLGVTRNDTLAFKEALWDTSLQGEKLAAAQWAAYWEIGNEGRLLATTVEEARKGGDPECQVIMMMPLAAVMDDQDRANREAFLPVGLLMPYLPHGTLHDLLDHKPQNFLFAGPLPKKLSPQEAHLLARLLSIDSGLGWSVTEQPERDMNLFRGSPNYASPESVDPKRPQSLPTDVWSACKTIKTTLPGGLPAVRKPMKGFSSEKLPLEHPLRKGMCAPFQHLCEAIGGYFGEFLSTTTLPLGLMADPSQRLTADYLYNRFVKQRQSVLDADIKLAEAGDPAAFL